MTKIKAQAGTDEANYGTESFPVPADGIIDVPPEAAADLIHEGGFVPVVDDDPAADAAAAEAIAGLVPMHGQPGSSCSVDGLSFNANDKGVVMVPASAVLALTSHGFTPEAA